MYAGDNNKNLDFVKNMSNSNMERNRKEKYTRSELKQTM